MRRCILTRALSFPPDPGSPTPRAAMCIIACQNAGATRVLYEFLSTCHSNSNNFLLLILPLGFPLLQNTATQPVTLTMRSSLCSAICTLPRKLEVPQQASSQEQGISGKRQLPRHWDDLYFFSFSTHMHFKVCSLGIWPTLTSIHAKREYQFYCS